MTDTARLQSARDFILWAERRFHDEGLSFGHGTDNARDEAVWLVTTTLGFSIDAFDARLDRPLEETQKQSLITIINARATTRKPAAYLLNEAWFAGLPFYVDERVLIPRSHLAEFIEEQFQPWIESSRVQRIMDLGTGSGCIAVAAAQAFPGAHIDAVDIDPAALDVARMNIDKYHLQDRIRLIRSDLFDALADERYDVILSNPPYVSSEEMTGLPPEFCFEPARALAAGKQGLDFLVRILAVAGAHLQPGGILMAETGNAAEKLQQQFPVLSFMWLTTSTGDESVFVLNQEALASGNNAAR